MANRLEESALSAGGGAVERLPAALAAVGGQPSLEQGRDGGASRGAALGDAAATATASAAAAHTDHGIVQGMLIRQKEKRENL